MLLVLEVRGRSANDSEKNKNSRKPCVLYVDYIIFILANKSRLSTWKLALLAFVFATVGVFLLMRTMLSSFGAGHTFDTMPLFGDEERTDIAY